MTICPCCGSEVTAALLIDLNTNTVTFHGTAREVRPPQVIELLQILHRAWPRTVSYELIADGLWGLPDDGRSSAQHRQHLATLASWARSAVRQMGIDIEAVSGRGYRLVLLRQPLATAAGVDRRLERASPIIGSR